MLILDIHPFAGISQAPFGEPRAAVHAAFGAPSSSQAPRDEWGITDFWFDSCLNIRYDAIGRVEHVGFGAGRFELRFLGEPIWPGGENNDPNPILLCHDRAPLETLGFLVFTKIGVTTSGYHNEYPEDEALTVFPEGAWAHHLGGAARPNLSRYGL